MILRNRSIWMLLFPALFITAFFVIPVNAQAAEWHIQDNATGGDCSSIGVWDAPTKTCTLSQDLSQGIIMEGVNISLDGSGHTINGNSAGNGVYLNGNTGITIKNLNVQNFLNGILLSEAFNNTLTGNTTSNNNIGISIIDGSSNNILTSNTASNNSDSGIFLYSAINNALTGNTANSNHIGIYLYSSATNYNTLTDNSALNNSVVGIAFSGTNNTLTGNIASNNGGGGIYISFASNNTLTGNTTSNNNIGISVYSASNNTITDNTISANNATGISLISFSNNNKIFKNNFVNNSTQVFVETENSSENIFNLVAPTGGNYWSNFDESAEGCNDVNNDSFCDTPHTFTGGQDNLPWTVQGGWTSGQQMATLTVIKEVVNGNGGTKVASDFTIEVSGTDVSPTTFLGSEAGSVVILAPGAYSVSETPVAEYTGSFGADCSGTISSGEARTCIITNTDIPSENGTLTLTNLTQSAGILGGVLNEGSSVRDAVMTFNAQVSDSDTEPVRFEVELRRFEEPFTGVKDGGILSSDSVSSGGIASITRHGLTPGFYHWRARAVDTSGAESEWSEFGTIGNIDFEIMASYPVKLEQSQQYRVYYPSLRTEAFGKRTPIFSTRQFTDADGNLVTNPVLAKKIAMTAYIYEKITNPQFAINIEQGAIGANNMLNDFLAVTTIEALERCIPSAGAAVIVGPATTLNCVLERLKDTAVLDTFTGVNLVRAVAMALTEDLKDRYVGIKQKTDPFINGEAVIDYDSATTTFSMIYKGTFLIEPMSTDLLFKLGKMDSGPWDQFFDLIYKAALGLFDVVFMVPDSQESTLVSTFTPAAHTNWDYTSALNYLATDNRLPQYAEVFDKLTDVLSTAGNLTDTADDFSARYQFTLALQQAIDNWGERIATGDHQSYIEVAKLSPGELRVFDNEGNITGLVGGVIKKEIPGSDYVDGRVWLPDTIQSYRYEVVGTIPGLYGLDFQKVDNGNITKFGAVDIPMATSTIHEYQIDWQALAAGESGVTLKVDRNGDGVFENVITTGSTLTGDDFVLQTDTTVDFVPNAVNLRSMGKVVTAYIELPKGFNVSQIDISSIRLNRLIPALTKPTSVGDYDNDGATDLMVKFDGASVRNLLAKAHNGEVVVSGKVAHSGAYLNFLGTESLKLVK